jgi:hypothetical protein
VAVVDLGGTSVIRRREGNARHTRRAIGNRVTILDAGVPGAAVESGGAIAVRGTSSAARSGA